MKEQVFLSGCVLIFALISCNKNDRPNIGGFWYSIENDTTYEETVLTNSDLWSYNSRIGEVYRKYEIVGDSISFSDTMNKIVLKFSLVNQNEFMLRNSFYEAHYYRIDLSLDPEKVIQNPAIRQEYTDGLKMRKRNWRNDKNLIQ